MTRAARQAPRAAGPAALVLLAGVYAFMAGTGRGRTIDGTLAYHDFGLDQRWDVVAHGLLALLSPPSVALAVLVALWLARRQGRRSDGIRVAIIVVAAAGAARGLEAALGALDPLSGERARALGPEFFPSGHSTVAMALSLGAMVLLREHRRPFALACWLWCSGVGFALVAIRL